MTTGDKIYKLRKEKGLSQEQLAEALDISRQTLSKWELNAVLPDTENIIKLSSYFGVTTDYLLKEDKGEQPQQIDPVMNVTKKSSLSKRALALIDEKGYLGAYIMALYCLLGLLSAGFILYAYLSVMISLAPLKNWLKVPPSLLLPGVAAIAMIVVLVKACFYLFLGRKLKKLSLKEDL